MKAAYPSPARRVKNLNSIVEQMNSFTSYWPGGSGDMNGLHSYLYRVLTPGEFITPIWWQTPDGRRATAGRNPTDFARIIDPSDLPYADFVGGCFFQYDSYTALGPIVATHAQTFLQFGSV